MFDVREEAALKIDNYKIKRDIQNEREFVESLIYESVGLMDENMRLMLENKRLKNKLEEVNRLYYELLGRSDLFGEREKQVSNLKSSVVRIYRDIRDFSVGEQLEKSV